MTRDRLRALSLRLRASAEHPRTKRAVAVLTAAIALGAGASAGGSTGPDWRPTVERVAAITGGDLSNARLRDLAPEGGSAFLIASRVAPAGPQADTWGRTPGWPNLDVSVRPDIGVGRLEGERAQRINEAIPTAPTGLEAATPFVFRGNAAERKKALRCLAQAVYYESALEPRRGQEAVAQVVLNRVRDPNYPKTVCGVVFQGADLKTGCQFSFTCDGSMARGAGGPLWRQSQEVAERALGGYVADWVGTATHYHADYVFPYWAPSLVKLEKVGRHIFYRWPGWAGRAAALSGKHAGREPWIDEAKYSRPRATTPALETLQVTETLEGGKRFTMTFAARGPAGVRRATPEDIAKINESLGRFERGEPETPVAAAPTWQEPTSAAPAIIR
jgi:hypothetical protein